MNSRILGTVAIMIGLLLIVGMATTAHLRRPVPTVEQSYAALRFDQSTFKPTPAIVCNAAYWPQTEEMKATHYYIGVQLGDTCTPSSTLSVYTYENAMPVGQRVVLKMDTTGQWWARPVGKRF